jgi:hypothetical protein
MAGGRDEDVMPFGCKEYGFGSYRLNKFQDQTLGHYGRSIIPAK